MLLPAPEILSEALSRVATGLARLKGINETAEVSTTGYDIQFDEWDWEVGVGIYGLLRHAESIKDQSLIDAIARWYDWQIGRGLPPRQVNSTSPMLPLCVLIDHVDRPDWEVLIKDWAQWLVTSLAKTEDGGFQHVVKERLNEGELWDDTLFMTCLFLARAGQRFDRPDWVEEAFYQFMVHERYLADPVTGLWYHGWTFNGRHNFARAFWARGNSWITVAIPELFGLVDCVPEHLKRHLMHILGAQLKTLAKHQRDSGMFNTLVCDPTSPAETSATAAIAYGILKGVDLGIVDRGYRQVAERALAAVLDRIDSSGIVLEVSDGTPMGHTLEFYRNIPNVPAPYGQALVMLLLARAMKEARSFTGSA